MLMENNITASVVEITMSGERRHNLRLYEPYPTRVRGIAETGEAFTLETVVDNSSSGGLYLRTPIQVNQKKILHVIVCFTTLNTYEQSAPRLWIRGKVLRSERYSDGKFGIALAVKKYKCL